MAPTNDTKSFEQAAPPTASLGEMALTMTSRIGDSRPAPFAGFVWHRPIEPSPDVVRQRMGQLLCAADAA